MPAGKLARSGEAAARPKANVDLFLRDMNGAVAAAGGDMAKAALAAGLVDKRGRTATTSKRGSPSLAAAPATAEAPSSGIKLGAYITTSSTGTRPARSGSSPSPA